MSESKGYNKVTRQMVLDLKEEFNKRFDKIDQNITNLFNHQSTRIPPWAAVTISVLTALVGGLIGRIL